MPRASHPVRDGLIAVAIGSVLALVLVFSVRAIQGPGRSAAGEPGVGVETPGVGADACEVRDSGGGGGPVEPDPTPGPDFPRQDFVLDTGRPISVRGTGNAEIAYQRIGEFATVVGFDCADCNGDLTVFNTGAALPIVSGETVGERVEVQWLIDTIHEQADGPRNSLLIRAQGRWSLTLRSWFDLPIRTGKIQGTGSAVVRTDSDLIRVTFAPLNSRDSLNIYSYRLADREFRANTCIGRRESRTLDLNGGQVLLLWARGDWTIEPV